MMKRMGRGALLAATTSRATSRRSQQCRRCYHELSYLRTGASSPLDVLEYNNCQSSTKEELPPSVLPRSTAALVRVDVHAAPWNPADANVVQGRYPSPYDDQEEAAAVKECQQSRFFGGRFVAGSEGIGRVSEIIGVPQQQQGGGEEEEERGPELFDNHSSSLNVGDWVTFSQAGLGTMRSSLWVPPNALVNIDRGDELVDRQEQGAAQASTLFQLGGTAYRLLKDFGGPCPEELSRKSKKKKQGESANDINNGFVVLQNAGNSGVGFMVSQLASALYPDDAVAVVSLVRRADRSVDDMDELVEHFMVQGKNRLVVVEEDLLAGDDNADGALRRLKSQLREISDRSPSLALNAVGGASSDLLLKLLGPSGTHVTYGGMSERPVTVSTPQLIFRDVTVCGYWHSRWMVHNPLPERTRMVNDLVDLVLDSALHCPPVRVFPLSEFERALECEAEQKKKAIRSKIVFDCRE